MIDVYCWLGFCTLFGFLFLLLIRVQGYFGFNIFV